LDIVDLISDDEEDKEPEEQEEDKVIDLVSSDPEDMEGHTRPLDGVGSLQICAQAEVRAEGQMQEVDHRDGGSRVTEEEALVRQGAAGDMEEVRSGEGAEQQLRGEVQEQLQQQHVQELAEVQQQSPDQSAMMAQKIGGGHLEEERRVQVQEDYGGLTVRCVQQNAEAGEHAMETNAGQHQTVIRPRQCTQQLEKPSALQLLLESAFGAKPQPQQQRQPQVKTRIAAGSSCAQALLEGQGPQVGVEGAEQSGSAAIGYFLQLAEGWERDPGFNTVPLMHGLQQEQLQEVQKHQAQEQELDDRAVSIEVHGEKVVRNRPGQRQKQLQQEDQQGTQPMKIDNHAHIEKQQQEQQKSRQEVGNLGFRPKLRLVLKRKAAAARAATSFGQAPPVFVPAAAAAAVNETGGDHWAGILVPQMPPAGDAAAALPTAQTLEAAVQAAQAALRGVPCEAQAPAAVVKAAETMLGAVPGAGVGQVAAVPVGGGLAGDRGGGRGRRVASGLNAVAAAFGLEVVQGYQHVEEVLEWEQDVPMAAAAGGGEGGVVIGSRGEMAAGLGAAEGIEGGQVAKDGAHGSCEYSEVPLWLQLAKEDPQLVTPSWQLVRLAEAEAAGSSSGHQQVHDLQQWQAGAGRTRIPLQSPQCVWMFGSAVEGDRKNGHGNRPGWRSCMIDVPLPPDTYVMQGTYLYVDQMGPQLRDLAAGQNPEKRPWIEDGSWKALEGRDGACNACRGRGGDWHLRMQEDTARRELEPPRVFLHVPRGAVPKGSKTSLEVLLNNRVPPGEARGPVLLQEGDVLTVQGAKFQLQRVPVLA
jgi:hypothetical protein